MTTSPIDPRRELYLAALQAARQRFVEAWEQWKAIDAKSQASAAVAGVLLTGLLAFLKDWHPKGQLGPVLFVLTLLLVSLAALLAVLALRIRFVAAAPHANLAKAAEEAVAAAEEEDEESLRYDRLLRFMNDERGLWDQASASNEQELATKAGFLSKSQWFLLAAMVTVGLVILVRFFDTGTQ